MAELRGIIEDNTSIRYPEKEKTDEQKEKDAENFLRVFIWVVGVLTAFILFVCIMNIAGENYSRFKHWSPLLYCLIADIITMFVSLSVLRIVSGITRNLREINRKLK